MAKSIFDGAIDQITKAAKNVVTQSTKQAAKQVNKQTQKKKTTGKSFYEDHLERKQSIQPSAVQSPQKKTFIPVTPQRTAFASDSVFQPQQRKFVPAQNRNTAIQRTKTAGNANVFTPSTKMSSFVPQTTAVPLRDRLGMMNRNGNVNHLKRPVIGTSMLENAGWGKQNKGYATVYSSSFSNRDGTKTVLVTPILQSGRVLTPRELERAANDILQTGRDDNNILLGTFTGRNSVDEANRYGQNIHKLHEQYYTNPRTQNGKKMSDKDMRKMIEDTEKEDFGSFYLEEKEKQEKIAKKYNLTKEEQETNYLMQGYQKRLSKYADSVNKSDFAYYTSGAGSNKAHDKVGEMVRNILNDKGDYSKMEDTRSYKRYYRENENGTVEQIRTNNSNADGLKYMYMTAEEYQIYKYRLNKLGEEYAEKYLKDIEPLLDKRRTQLTSKYKQEYAKEHKVKASAASIIGSVFSGLPALADVIEQTNRQAQQGPDNYIPYNPYSPMTSIEHSKNALREGVIGDLEGAPKFFANTAFSIGENVARLPLEMVNPAVGLGLMGLNVAGSTAVNQGVSGETNAGKALLTGAVFGAVEIATEKLSLDNLIKVVNAPTTTAREFAKTFVPNMLKQAGIEASEEVAANIADHIADSLINGDKSEYSKRVNELMQQGHDRGTAEGLAFKELYIDQTLEDGLSGALSGLVMGGFGGAASSAVNTYNEATTLGREYNIADNNYEAVRGLIEEGKASERQTAANKYAERMGKKLDKRGRLSDWNVGRQVVKNEAAIEGEKNFAKASSNIKDTEIVSELWGKDKDGNKIELNGANSDTNIYASTNGSQSVNETIKHELSHEFKKKFPEIYQKYEDTIIQAAMDADSEAVNNRMDKLMKDGHSEAAAREEIAAEIATGFNTRAVQRMAEGNTNFTDRITQAFRTAKAKLRADFTDGKFTSPTGVSATFDGLNQAEKQFLQGMQNARGNTAQTGDVRYSAVGKTIDGKTIYKTNYPANTPKQQKQADLINIVQNVWSQKPITLQVGNNQTITAQFDPDLSTRSDLSKIVFGNRKGTAKEQRITLNLASDLYQIAQESQYQGEKSEIGKANPAHKGVKSWKYYVTDLVYVEDDGTKIPGHMNIDVKQKSNGSYFYSFAFEKGIAPQTLLAAVNEKNSPTIPSSNSISKNNPIVKNSIRENAPKINFGAKADIDAWNEILEEYVDTTRARQGDTNGSVYSRLIAELEKDFPLDAMGLADDVITNLDYAPICTDKETQIYSDNFKKWFGDWQNNPVNASKVVNADGTPKVVYHGTPYGGFTVFDAAFMNFGVLGKVPHFTESRDIAEVYSNKDMWLRMARGNNPTVYEVYLDIKNPLYLEKQALPEWNEALNKNGVNVQLRNGDTNENVMLRARETILQMNISEGEQQAIFGNILSDMGYDGITYIAQGAYQNSILPDEINDTKHRVWAPLKSTQIKSATDNIDTFDKNNPDIRYSIKEEGGKPSDSLVWGPVENDEFNDADETQENRFVPNPDAAKSEPKARFTPDADINEIVNSDMTDAEKRKALEEKAHFIPQGGRDIFAEGQKRGKEHFDKMYKVEPSEYSEDDWESYGEDFGTDNMRQDMQQRSDEAERRDREAFNQRFREAFPNSQYSDEDWDNLTEPVDDNYDWTKDGRNWSEPGEKPKTATELDAEADETVRELMEEQGVDSPDQLAEETVSRADIRKAKIKHYLSPKGIHEIGTMAYTRMVDDMHPIWNYTDSFEKAMTRSTDENGKKVVKFTAIGKHSPYKMAMNAKDATSRSAYLITDYLTDFDANIIGKGLNDTIAESSITPKTLEDFNEYLVAKNAIYWLDEKRGGKYKKVYEDDRKNNWRVAKKIADAFESKHPEFRQAAENIYEWEKRMGQAWLVDTGVITQEQWDYLWKMYPNYVPFFRAEMVNSAGGWTGLVEVDNVFKKAAGSSQKILSPIENIMYNTASYVNHAYKHAVVKAAVDMYDTLESDPENNVLREFLTEVVPADPAELTPTRFIEKTTLTKNDLRRATVQQRFSENVDKAFSGEITERTPITIGDTPSLYKKYGAGDNPITITQSTMYKIAYPTGYIGAEENGHNLGIPALKQLPKQIAAPIAILKSNTQQNSLIALTEWEDANGNPVIIPLHLDKNGALGLTNEVASAYGKKDIEPLLTDKNGNSTVLYTKNNESIHQLLSSRLQLPAAASDDTLVKHNISNNEGNVNSVDFAPDNRDLANAVSGEDEAAITRTLRQQTGVDYGVVSVMDNGQMRYFRVNDKEFLKAIDNTRKGREAVFATAAAITRARGALLTTLNPAFSLVTNTIRDAGTYLTNSTDKNKFRAIGAAGMAYVDMAKNAYHQAKGDTYSNDVTQFIAMGGQYSNLHTAGTNQLKKAMNDMRGGKLNTAKNIATFIPRAYFTAGDAIESAPRVGQFKRSLAQGDDIHEAIYQAKDVTVNFSRMGSWGKYLNTFSNFFNAAIQGIDKVFRMAKNNPGSMAVGMAALALVSAAAYGFSHLKKDDKYDEAWKDLSNYQKNNNWNFYIGGGKFVSIPKPRENATLITAGEAAIDKYMFNQDDRFKEFFSNYILSALPDGNIPFVTSLIQIGMNEDYRGVPIVSKELQNKPKELQFDDTTTYFAKWLGQKTGQSPKQIDHILSNETGALQRANKTYGSPNGLKDPAAMWSFGLSNTFFKDAYYSTDMTNSFYTNKENAEKQANGYPSADTEYLNSRYSQAGNVMGIINQMVKDNADDKFKGRKRDLETNRWFKRAYTNYAAEYKDNPLGLSDEVYNEIKGLYDEDKSIFKLPEINKEIKADKKSYTFTDPYTVMQYQKDVNNAVDKAYRDVISTAEYQVMDNADKAAALKKAKEDAVKEVKQFYVENNGKGVMQDRNNSGAEIKQPTQEEMEQAEADIAAAKAIQDKKTSVTDTYLQDIVDRYNPDKFNHDGKTLSEMSEIGDVKTAKIGNRTYDLNEDTQKKVKASATEKFYDSLEKFYSGEVNVEDVIGLTAKGDYRYVEHEIDGKKIKQSLRGGRYNADGTERFDDFTLEKIATKIKEKAIADATEEYADEITGKSGKQTADVKPVASTSKKSNGIKTASGGKSYSNFSPRRSYSKRSGGSGGRRSSGGGSSGGGGRSGGGKSVSLDDLPQTFTANNALYGSLGRTGNYSGISNSPVQVASNRFVPSIQNIVKPKKMEILKPLRMI